MNDEEDMLPRDIPRYDDPPMRGPRVVAAVDGSTGSKAALRFALADAARRDLPIEAVMAYRPPDYWLEFNVIGAADDDRMRHHLHDEAHARLQAAVDEVVATMPGPVPEVSVHVVAGAAADVLIRESEGADLLVVGSRGHGGFASVLLGSTSMQCAQHATCPVTVVHSSEAHRHRLRLHRERRNEAATVN